MAYPYDAGDLAAISRCGSFYNGNAYNASTNAGGMAAGGHRVNFTPSLQDAARIASAIALAASAADTSATAASSSAASAANSVAALTGTSTTSISIGTGSKTFTTQANKLFTVGSFVLIESDANPTINYMEGQVTAYSGTSLTINATVVGGSGSHSDWTILGRVGAPGVQGSTGLTGAMGTTPALQWAFGNGTSDSDPGNGTFLINNATYSAATFLYFDNLDTNGASATTWLDALDDSTTTSNRGTLFVQEIGTTHYAAFTVTGAVVDGTGYRKVPVAHVMSNGALTNGAACAVTFQRTGNAGTDGLGAGDTISDISSVTDGRLAIFSGTSGKHITNASYGIGTSGANLGALNAANTWSGVQSLAALLDVQQDFRLSGDITPTQIAANTDNYAPTGNATASVFRLSTDASRNLTGIANGADGRLILLINVGSFDIVLKNDVTSTAANRFLFGADFTLAAGQALQLIYDATASRWRQLNSIGLGAAGSASRPTWSFAGDPDTGVYNVSANVLGFGVNGTGYAQLAASAFSPIASDGTALGTSSLMWSDLFLASGGVLNFNNGNLTVTHGTGALTFSASALSLYLTDTAVANATFRLMTQAGNTTKLFRIYDDSNSADRLTIDANGQVKAVASTGSTSSSSGSFVTGGGLGVAENINAAGLTHHFGTVATTGSAIVYADGGNSGTSGGASFRTSANGTTLVALGNLSGIAGGAYDATGLWYNANAAKIYTNGALAVTISTAGALTAVGSVTATALVPSSTTIPTIGMYKPTGNGSVDMIGFATGGVEWLRGGSSANTTGRGNAFSAMFTCFSNGLSFKGSGTSGVIGAIDFADSALVQCGSINIDQSTHHATYNTSSDVRGKPNRELLSLDFARSRIDALKIWDFDKPGNSIRGIGVIAQEAFVVHKSLAYRPRDPAEWWQAEKAGPVPFLVANMQQANSRLDDHESRIGAIEQKLAA